MWIIGFRVRSSRLHSKRSYPRSHLPSPKTFFSSPLFFWNISLIGTQLTGDLNFSVLLPLAELINMVLSRTYSWNSLAGETLGLMQIQENCGSELQGFQLTSTSILFCPDFWVASVPSIYVQFCPHCFFGQDHISPSVCVCPFCELDLSSNDGPGRSRYVSGNDLTLCRSRGTFKCSTS